MGSMNQPKLLTEPYFPMQTMSKFRSTFLVPQFKFPFQIVHKKTNCSALSACLIPLCVISMCRRKLSNAWTPHNVHHSSSFVNSLKPQLINKYTSFNTSKAVMAKEKKGCLHPSTFQSCAFL